MEKKKQLIRYAIWGVASALLNIGMSQAMVYIGIDYKIANAVTLVTVKLFCYFTNKLFVFKTPFENMRVFAKELINFILARWVTFCVDYVGVILLVEVLKQSFFISKCILSILVITLNFVLSKCFVFKNRTESSQDGRETE